MTLLDMCNAIAAELNKRGIVIKNLKTGLVVKTGMDVYNFSSTGELSHVWDWYYGLGLDQPFSSEAAMPPKP